MEGNYVFHEELSDAPDYRIYINITQALSMRRQLSRLQRGRQPTELRELNERVHFPSYSRFLRRLNLAINPPDRIIDGSNFRRFLEKVYWQ